MICVEFPLKDNVVCIITANFVKHFNLLTVSNHTIAEFPIYVVASVAFTHVSDADRSQRFVISLSQFFLNNSNVCATERM